LGENREPDPVVVLDGSWVSEGDALIWLTAEIYRGFPTEALARRRHPIRISPRNPLFADHDPPTTLYNGLVFDVVLDTESRRWSQFAYQLSHELCHVLLLSPAIDGIAEWNAELHMPNKWLEETLCVLASFYVLPRIEEAWLAHPPFRAAASYARSFGEYIQNESGDTASIPVGMPFFQWLKGREEYLRDQAYDRPVNAAIAKRLLPLFDARPSLWFCTTFLLADDGNSVATRATLVSLLRAWRGRSPAECTSDIDAFANVLGYPLQ